MFQILLVGVSNIVDMFGERFENPMLMSMFFED